ncbi:MAG: hypothetical protein ABIQ84_02515 [Usitatibacter sp.]
MARKSVTASELHDLLSREFRKTAGDHCLRCRVPIPAFMDSKSGGANWRVGTLDECSTLCHSILEDLVSTLSAKYEIRRPLRSK